MLSLVIIFAWTIAIIPVQGAYSLGAQDIDSILKILQQQQKAELQQNHRHGDFTSISDDSSDNDKAQFGSLKKQQALNTMKNQWKDRGTNDVKYRVGGNERHRDQLLAHLLSHMVQADDRKQIQPKDGSSEHVGRIQPTNMLDLTLPYRDNNVRTKELSSDLGDLSDYSKIYIVLNPEAVRGSRNKNALNDMVSRVLALSSSTNQKSRHNSRANKKYYKGFAVNNDLLSRRSRRHSNENSEGEHRPKRLRSEFGGGGGGSGARTAIPYIRHRGDIYEKDH